MKNFIHKTGFSKVLYLIILIIITYTIGIQGCCATSSNLKFAQISDAHFSTFEADTSFKLLKSSADLLDDAIMQVNNTTNLDFVMFTGDMINQPQQDQLLSFIKHANLICYPWYVVFGNHDISHGGRLSKKMYCDILNGHSTNYCYTCPYYSFTPKKGYKVIGLDTIIDYKMTSQGEISEDQLKWLKNELDHSKHNTIIIFTHVPLIEPFPSENHKLKNSYDVKLLLKKYDNPIIVCSGHYHATKIFQEDNILYINTPSLVSYPNAFRIINLSPKRKHILVDVYLKETRLKALQSKAKLKGMGSNMLYGSEADRTYTYEVPRKRNFSKVNTTNIYN